LSEFMLTLMSCAADYQNWLIPIAASNGTCQLNELL